MARTTKTNMVKHHLKSGKTITSLQAINLYGATRLSSIIHRLRKEGFIIATLPTVIKDKYGNNCTYAKYRMVDVTIYPKGYDDELAIHEEDKEETKGTFNKNFIQKLWSKITSEEQ